MHDTLGNSSSPPDSKNPMEESAEPSGACTSSCHSPQYYRFFLLVASGYSLEGKQKTLEIKLTSSSFILERHNQSSIVSSWECW